jgi:uncharacterized membrane-anchored protein
MPELFDPTGLDSAGPDKQPPSGPWTSRLDTVLFWLRARESWVLLATVVFQLLVLMGMIAGKSLPYRAAEVILLRVVPVDPRDLFRGDYVTLGYEISRVPREGIAGLPALTARNSSSEWRGQTVYVTLFPENDGKHYRGGPVSAVRPPPGTRFIKGTLASSSLISFGIESYFVQEGQGKNYEAAIRDHHLSAEIALTPAGSAALRGLRIE